MVYGMNGKVIISSMIFFWFFKLKFCAHENEFISDWRISHMRSFWWKVVFRDMEIMFGMRTILYWVTQKTVKFMYTTWINRSEVVTLSQTAVRLWHSPFPLLSYEAMASVCGLTPHGEKTRCCPIKLKSHDRVTFMSGKITICCVGRADINIHLHTDAHKKTQ